MSELLSSANERQPYLPKAIYYEASDSLEYVRRDYPAVYRRVDEYLTLVLDLENRQLLGFKLKGFRHLYLTELKPKYRLQEGQFLSLIKILESAMSLKGNAIFELSERRLAYKEALELASEDDVIVSEFPIRASG